MYPRKVVKDIEKYLDKKEIVILLWARQVWKTSIMKYFFSEIKEQKIWFNLDKISNCEIFSRAENVLSYLKLKNIDLNEKI